MSKLLVGIIDPQNTQCGKTYMFFCPGCESYHFFPIYNDGRGPWKFNGDLEKPTFTPSLRVGDNNCHLNITDGKIIYHNDSKHHLAGKTVEMENE